MSYFTTRTIIDVYLANIAVIIIYPLLLIGVFAYIFNYFTSLINEKPATNPLDLAGIAGTIGGLILVSAFYQDKNIETTNARKLKTIAKLFLGSAVSFVVLFFLSELSSMMGTTTASLTVIIINVALATAIIAACLSMGMALALLIQVIKYI